MLAADAPLTASEVLRVFHQDEPYLFLGAAFTTVGLVSAGFSLLRRKLDPLLIWLAAFAFLYGQRLWIQSSLLSLLIPPSPFFSELRSSFNYLVPIPAFQYFSSAGLLGTAGRRIAALATAFFLALWAATFLAGPLPAFRLANNVVIIATLLIFAARMLASKHQGRDAVIVRRGLLVFAGFALWDNVAGTLRFGPSVEPLGFAFFLSCLGYVAGRRILHRDQQLGELQKELEVARRIQMSILPAAFPPSTHFRVATRYVPMTSVAGDFYEFLVSDDHQAGLLVADVSGHGVPAALIASMVKLAASSQRPHAADPAALLSGMNVVLCGNTQSQFVTAAYVHLDATAGQLRYSAAAHPPMLLLRNGEVREILENGLMLAAFSFASYANAVHPIEPGDRLLLYTDGLLEAANAHEEQYGQARLCAVFREVARLPLDEAADRIMDSVQQWSAAQDDDRTVLVCDYVAAV